MCRNLYNFSGLENKKRGNEGNIPEKYFKKKAVYKFLIYMLLTANTLVYSQKPKGIFLTDSIELGKPISFALSYRHNPADEIFFPDTSYNFHPFEMIKRDYFTTQTNAIGSLDSVVYTLVSFDTRKIQKLSLPIYIHNKQDCTAVFSLIDSVYLKEMIRGSLDSLTLKTDTKFLQLKPQVNYPRLFAYLLGILILGGLVYLMFGKLIRKQYRLFLFGRKHKEFVSNYKKFTRGFLDDKNISKAVVLWKNHLEWLEKRPYSSYTTKEIVARIPNENLEEALRDVDSAIYGGILSTQMPFAMNVLLKTATELYKKRREEIED